jgi:hypothetical protein
MISFTTSRGPSHDACDLSDQSELAADGRCNRFYEITTSFVFRDFQLHRTESLVDVILPYVEDIRHWVSWQGTFTGVLLDVPGCEERNAKYMEYF